MFILSHLSTAIDIAVFHVVDFLFSFYQLLLKIVIKVYYYINHRVIVELLMLG